MEKIGRNIFQSHHSAVFVQRAIQGNGITVRYRTTLSSSMIGNRGVRAVSRAVEARAGKSNSSLSCMHCFGRHPRCQQLLAAGTSDGRRRCCIGCPLVRFQQSSFSAKIADSPVRHSRSTLGWAGETTPSSASGRED